MIHVERYLEASDALASDTVFDEVAMARQPFLAASALTQISLEQGHEPLRFKRGKPIFQHTIRAIRRGGTLTSAGIFSLNIRLGTEMPEPSESSGYYALFAASMKVIGDNYGACFEFSDAGYTSIQDASTKTDSGLWAVANSWHQLDTSVATYARLNS